MAVTSRAWRGYDDLRPMQELAIEVRRREGRRTLREEGAESAIVYSYNERAAALYDAVGFERHTRVAAYSREPGGETR